MTFEPMTDRPVLVGGLEERPHEQPRGVVDPDVEPAELVDRDPRDPLGRRRISGVGLDEPAARAERFHGGDRLGRRRPFVCVGIRPVGADDVGTPAGEGDRGRLTDAHRCAGDDRDRHRERYSIFCRWPVSCERTIASQISAQR